MNASIDQPTRRVFCNCVHPSELRRRAFVLYWSTVSVRKQRVTRSFAFILLWTKPGCVEIFAQSKFTKAALACSQTRTTIITMLGVGVWCLSLTSEKKTWHCCGLRNVQKGADRKPTYPPEPASQTQPPNWTQHAWHTTLLHEMLEKLECTILASIFKYKMWSNGGL